MLIIFDIIIYLFFGYVAIAGGYAGIKWLVQRFREKEYKDASWGIIAFAFVVVSCAYMWGYL